MTTTQRSPDGDSYQPPTVRSTDPLVCRCEKCGTDYARAYAWETSALPQLVWRLGWECPACGTDAHLVDVRQPLTPDAARVLLKVAIDDAPANAPLVRGVWSWRACLAVAVWSFIIGYGAAWLTLKLTGRW